MNTFLRSLGMGAVALFVPVYLYQLFGLKTVILYILSCRLSEIFLTYPAAKFISKIGYRKSTIIGTILLLLTIVMLKLSQNNWSWMWLNVIFSPLAALLYWLPRHLLILSTKEDNYGQTISIFHAAMRWSAVIGPILGGLLISVWRFGGLFDWGMVFIAVSIVPLFWEPDKLNWQFHLQDFWTKVESGWFRKDLIAYVGYGLEETMFEYFWVIFLFINLQESHLGLGVYKTILLLASSVLVFVVGRYLDKHYKNKFMMTASIILGVLWLFRGFVVDKFWLLGIDVFDGLAALFLFITFEFYAMHRNRHADAPLYTFEREVGINIGRVLAAIGMGIFYFLGLGWPWMVSLGIVGVILMNFLPKDAIAQTITRQ